MEHRRFDPFRMNSRAGHFIPWDHVDDDLQVFWREVEAGETFSQGFGIDFFQLKSSHDPSCQNIGQMDQMHQVRVEGRLVRTVVHGHHLGEGGGQVPVGGKPGADLLMVNPENRLLRFHEISVPMQNVMVKQRQ